MSGSNSFPRHLCVLLHNIHRTAHVRTHQCEASTWRHETHFAVVRGWCSCCCCRPAAAGTPYERRQNGWMVFWFLLSTNYSSRSTWCTQFRAPFVQPCSDTTVWSGATLSSLAMFTLSVWSLSGLAISVLPRIVLLFQFWFQNTEKILCCIVMIIEHVFCVKCSVNEEYERHSRSFKLFSTFANATLRTISDTAVGNVNLDYVKKLIFELCHSLLAATGIIFMIC